MSLKLLDFGNMARKHKGTLLNLNIKPDDQQLLQNFISFCSYTNTLPGGTIRKQMVLKTSNYFKKKINYCL